MSEDQPIQWHYEQKGESYIKVDTLHKIRKLESELAAARERIAKLKEQYTPWWARKRSEIDKLSEVTEQLNEARDTIAMLTNTLRNNNDAARAGYEELKADLHRRYRCFVCRDTGKTDGALGFNGYGPCPLCSLPNTQDQERNYLNDLNAIHEVEKTLDENQYIEYTSFLFEICDDWRNAATATAKQRAEAYRRTIGKWEGGRDE